MNAHLRANLWLLVLTVVLCCILYPLTLWGIGQTFFRQQAQGSLLDAKGRPITDEKDEKNAVGSRLIAQPFTDAQGNIADEYFQPRPSTASYNAAASGCSNLAASNPQLRRRVADQLESMVKDVKYRSGPKKGQLVAPDVEKWFQDQPAAGKSKTVSQLAKFCQWYEQHPDEDLQLIPADAVTTSGSGLDPDITLDNALWQLDRVAGAWAEKTGDSRDTVRKDIEKLLGQMSHSPAGGLFGEPLVNVLEINLTLRNRYQDHGH